MDRQTSDGKSCVTVIRDLGSYRVLVELQLVVEVYFRLVLV